MPTRYENVQQKPRRKLACHSMAGLLLCTLIGLGLLTACGQAPDTAPSNFVVNDILPTTTPLPTPQPEQPTDTPTPIPEQTAATQTPAPEQQTAATPDEATPGTSVQEPGITEDVNVIPSDVMVSVLPDLHETIDSIKQLPATTVVDCSMLDPATVSALFTQEPIGQNIYARIENQSFGEDCTVPLEALSYIRVLHYNFSGEVCIGELIVNVTIADDIIAIFQELFDAKYPIERMCLIDDYGADDLASMTANNTSAFNFRVIEGSTSLSNHAYGLAIDINPLYNPYVKERSDGSLYITPENGTPYADREADCTYYIRSGDICYEAFVSRGFTWGGDWTSVKDYQHFEKTQ